MKSFLFTILIIPLYIFTQDSYFQQETNYQIKVRLNDKEKTLSGFETIEYINNSPDTLTYLWFHIWPNAYSNNRTALARQLLNSVMGNYPPGLFSKKKYRGYIDSLDFSAGGKKIRWEYHPKHIDICKLYLNEPLLPGQSILIHTPFKVKLPYHIFSRSGYKGDAFQVSQWYPKPAVYDRKGWHEMPYLNQGEFYSEYGSFDVEITVPENYVVAATGNLQTEKEKAFLEKRIAETENKTVFDDSKNTFPPSDTAYKTLRYTEKNIHDFAWFADKRFEVLKGQVTLPHSGRVVNAWVFFPGYQAKLWKDALEYVQDAVYYYSLWYGDYPYDNCTAVQAALAAGGGMEYPTITVIGNMNSAGTLENVIAHEVGHNWFYGVLGSNERDHPWMDEGINSFSDQRYSHIKKEKERKQDTTGNCGTDGKYSVKVEIQPDIMTALTGRTRFEQGLGLKSQDYSELNYGLTVYQKAARIFWNLMDYLGEDTFDKAMQTYYATWQFKHPYPEDLKKIFEKTTGKNMDWLFEHLLKTNERIDYALKTKDKSLTIRNKGDFAAPVKLLFINPDTSVTRWVEPVKEEKTLTVPDIRDYRIATFDKETMDIFPRNNTLFPQQKFPAYKKVKFSLGHIVESPGTTYLNFIPFGGWNAYDGWMLGIWFNKPFIPMPKLEIHLLPMYGLKSKRVVGTGVVNYHHLMSGRTFSEIEFHSGFRQFSISPEGGYYRRIHSGITFFFNHPKAGTESKVSIFHTNVKNPDIFSMFQPLRNYFTLNYSWEYFKNINPKGVSFTSEITKDYVKTSLEAHYKVHYQGKDGLTTRIFLGGFPYRKGDLSAYYFSLNGGTGMSDYKFDRWYFARYGTEKDSFWNHQFYPSDAGFVTGEQISAPWMTAAGFSLDFPSQLKVPAALYTNVAYGEFPGNEKLFYETGVSVSFARGIFEIYFPFYYNPSLQTVENQFWKNFRFVLDFNKLKPSEISKMVR